MRKKAVLSYLVLIGLLLALVSGWYVFAFQSAESEPTERDVMTVSPTPNSLHTAIPLEPSSVPPDPSATPAPRVFDRTRAYDFARMQVELGSRAPGTEGHARVQELIRAELESAGWTVEYRDAERMGHPIRNIVAKRNGEAPQIILGAHYDTRFFADHDPDLSKRRQLVPGANDGASGVAVLLELAHTLPNQTVPVWLVFFDAEDNGRIEGWDWILGSRAFAEELEFTPRAVVVVDMVGDADLNAYWERSSDKQIRAEIWATAERLGYGEKLINAEKYGMIDDHTPFLEKGIPAVDIIDFDYPYWHTVGDTLDKISAESLGVVGDTLWHWVTEQK